MLLRLRYGRRVQTYLKIGTCILLGVCYFAFLFRESLNAYEQNKERSAESASATAVGKPAKLIRLQLRKQLLNRSRKSPTGRAVIQPYHQLDETKTAVAAPPSTLNPAYEYSEELHVSIERELLRRNAHLREVCERYNLRKKYPPNPWEFIISPGHNLVWCNVFKAASSTWMYYFNILGGYDVKYLQRTKTQPLELARKRFPRPELAELLDSLPASLSFLFVREPFERIISAYRNKLEGGRNTFYKALGVRIAHQYRRYFLGGNWQRGPTFDEFVRFLIAEYEQGHRFDEHWAPIYSFCTPCSVNFTLIGKVETFHRDTDYIIRAAGLESLLMGQLPRKRMPTIGNQARGGMKSDALVERYFSDIERSTLDQLLNIYRMDFELFGYSYKKYYDMVQPWSMPTEASAAPQVGPIQHNGSAKASATPLITTTTTTATVTGGA